MVISQKRCEVVEEIRHRVDALMREELDCLKMARRDVNLNMFIHLFEIFLLFRPLNETRARRASWPRSARRARRRRARRARRRRTRT